MEKELWITKIFNDHLAGLGNSALGVVGIHAEPRPWADYVTMEILVAAILVVLFAVLRPRLKRAFIRPDVLGSDHCPVGIELE